MKTRPTTPSTPSGRRRGARLAVAALAGILLIVIGGSPAGADTAAATATALRLAGTPIPGVASASNDGTVATVTDGGGSPAILPANPVLGAGAGGQLAVARNNGTSAACAGLIAPSSVITISPNGSCDPGTANAGITLNLADLLTLDAGAITAECTASSTGAPTGRARLVNATAKLAGLPIANLEGNPGINTTVGLQNILSIDLNKQTANPDGSITVVALSVQLLNQGLLEVGRVTCGPNAVTGDIPLVPAAGYPIAGAVLLAGGAALVIHRRRATTAEVTV